jgi:outer membrane protein
MKKLALCLLALVVCAAAPALAYEPGTMMLKFGVHNVDPKSDNGTVAGSIDLEVDSAISPTIMFEYFFAENLGIEILAALPFEHDVETSGTTVATVEHLPPTFTLQYHFLPEGKVQPFVGVGLNYTIFMSEETKGPIAGSDIDLNNSIGLAAHAGVDFVLGEKWALGIDARWIDIDADMHLNGAEVGTVEIDPIAYGAYAAWRF